MRAVASGAATWGPAAASGSASAAAAAPTGGSKSAAPADAAEAVLCSLIDDLSEELCFDLHRRARLRFLWPDEDRAAMHTDVHNNTDASISKLQCRCPHCSRLVGATRFAPHLEKCLRRSRGRRRDRDYSERDQATSQSLAKKSRVSEVQYVIQPEDEDRSCCVCDSGENEAELLLCDGCDRGCHLGCLAPPRKKAPAGWWFCDVCAANLCSTQVAASGFVAPNRAKQALIPASGERKPTVADLKAEGLVYFCDVCDGRVERERYRCMECRNFDLCRKCRMGGRNSGKHQVGHDMVAIKIID